MRLVEFSRLYNPSKIEPNLSLFCPILNKDELTVDMHNKLFKDFLKSFKGKETIKGLIVDYYSRLYQLAEQDFTAFEKGSEVKKSTSSSTDEDKSLI